jgi:hypothetical protein
VIVVLEDTAYEVREGDAPAVEVPAAEPASDPFSRLSDLIVQTIEYLVQKIAEQFAE